MEWQEFYVQASLLQHELIREVAKLKAAERRELRFGGPMPESVAEVAAQIYGDSFVPSMEGYGSTIVEGIINTIKKVIKAIMDLIRKFHAYVMKQNIVNKNLAKTIDNANNTPEKLSKNEKKIYEFTAILPKEKFQRYLTVASELREDLAHNTLLRMHDVGNLNRSKSHFQLLNLGFGFGEKFSIYRHDKTNNRIGDVETPDGFMTAVRLLLTKSCSPGEWTIDDVKHFVNKVYEFNREQFIIKEKQVKRQLEDYVSTTEQRVSDGEIDAGTGYEATASAITWYMSVFSCMTYISQSLNKQIQQAGRQVS